MSRTYSRKRRVASEKRQDLNRQPPEQCKPASLKRLLQKSTSILSMYLHAVYSPLFFSVYIRMCKRGRRMVFPPREDAAYQFSNICMDQRTYKLTQSSVLVLFMVLVSTIQRCSVNAREFRFGCTYKAGNGKYTKS